tara:strand:+ start:61 stop:588 length:528 start_codon:yes stop_codon:yes gene_type:complete
MMEGHIALIHAIVRFRFPEPRRKYAEIGIGNGATFNAVAPYFDVAVAIDANPDSLLHAETEHGYPMPFSDYVMLHGDEHEFDVAFLDAEHGKEDVLRDFDLLLPLIADNGIVLIHDTHPPNVEMSGMGYCRDAYMAAWEICQAASAQGYEAMTLPGDVGLTLIRKASKPVPWLEW